MREPIECTVDELKLSIVRLFFQVTCNLEDIVNTCIPNLLLEAELERLGHRESTHHDPNAKKDAVENEEMECKPIPTVLGNVNLNCR